MHEIFRANNQHILPEKLDIKINKKPFYIKNIKYELDRQRKERWITTEKIKKDKNDRKGNKKTLKFASFFENFSNKKTYC